LAPRLRLLALAAAALAASPACRRAPGAPPERFVSARSGWTLVVHDLRRASKELGSLHDTAATLPGMGALRQSRGALTSQLGFDPLDPGALADAGIDPARGLAIANEPPPGAPAGPLAAPVLVLPVRDAAVLERTVARLARERLGAPEQTASSSAGLRIVTFRAEGAEDGRLALALHGQDRVAAISAGPDAGEVVRRTLSRPAAESLGEAPTWRDLRAALGDRYAVTFALLRSPELAGWTFHTPYGLGAGRDLAIGFSAEGRALRAAIAVPFGEDAAALRALAAAGDSRSALRALSPDAPLVLRWDGDPSALGRLVVPRVPEHERRRLAEHGLDLQKDLFDVLAPGFAASVSLSPRIELRELSAAEVAADPLRVIAFELAGEVKDEARAAAALARLPALLAAPEGTGTGPAPAAPGPAPDRAGRMATPSGELAWRLDGKRLRVAGGAPGALEELAARTGAGWTAPSKASAPALEGGLGGAVLAPRALVAAVRRLPDGAYGDGPAGFIFQAVVDSYTATLRRLQAVSARAELAAAALVVTVEVEAAPTAKKEAKEEEAP
jgi:hypothetical protein